jgi:general secretion pathway protein D
MTDGRTARIGPHGRFSRGIRRNPVIPVAIGARALGFGYTVRWAILVPLLCLWSLAGCTSQVESQRTVTLEEPRVANGVIVDANDPAQLEEFEKALAAADLPTPPTAARGSAAGPAPQAAGEQEKTSPEKLGVAEALRMTRTSALPPETTKLLPLPELSRTEVEELAERLVLNLESELGYVAASAAVADALPIPPTGMVGGRTLARADPAGTHVLRFGYQCFLSQPPQFWALGVIVGTDGALSPNSDLAQIEPKVKEAVAAMDKMRTGLTVRDLEAQLVQLSYVDAATAMSMLKGFGMTTFDSAAGAPAKIEFAQLPYILSVKDPDSKYTGLVGAKTKLEAAGVKLSMAPGAASELEDNAISSPLTQLLVLFHPAHPEQYSEVRRLLDTFIDRPARQIFIEAMVLEISAQGLRDLGVEWALQENPYLNIIGGSLVEAGAATETFNATLANTSQIHQIINGNFQWDWEVRLRALIRSGKAQILSRPSVLTLDNRQSTIRVGEDIPIASSLEGGYGGGKIGFQFEYLPTGILLNIRPRISESGTEVSMLVDTIVSAKVPGQDLEIRSPDERVVLASAPTVSTRRVQTYSRIPNNTPLIIGGLVARESVQTQDKVPLLGDIPLLGMAFRAEKRERLKREVIIVLTPYVLPEQREVLRALPKDEDAFDNFGNDLFRDSYRIRSEDVFDLTFLLENQRIATYRDLARQAAQKNFRLAAVEPFRSFVRDSVPGESILVTRMIYEVIKRLDIARPIKLPNIICFEAQQVGGYRVKYLVELLKEKAKRGVVDFGDRALALTYRYDRVSLEEGRLGSEPIPEIRLIDCPDRKTWSKKLWELNQPTADGQRRHTILIHDASDLVRLRRALVVKRVVQLNGGVEDLRLRKFSVGKVLLMPEIKKGQIHVLDADTAMFFFHTEHYYAATLGEIEKELKELDQALRRPDIHILLEGELPEASAAAAGK